jgi:hypothetical protein
MIRRFSSMTLTGMMHCDVPARSPGRRRRGKETRGRVDGRIVKQGERIFAEAWPKLEWEGIDDGHHIRTCTILGEVEEAH